MENRRGAARRHRQRREKAAEGVHQRRRLRYHAEGARLSRAAGAGRGLSAVSARVASLRAPAQRRCPQEAGDVVQGLKRTTSMTRGRMDKVIDYYFTPVSPWTYLGHARFVEIAK